MATYVELMSSVDSVFASQQWADELVPAFPQNFYPDSLPNEFVRYEIIPSGQGVEEYGDPNYKAGLIILQIFTQANRGPKRTFEIAAKLEEHFENKLIQSTQVGRGTLDVLGIDKDDTSLFRADYSLQFNSF